MGKESKYVVRLEPREREYLEAIVREDCLSATVLTRAKVLLNADASAQGPAWSDEEIARVLEVCVSTVHNVRQRFAEQGLTAAVTRKPAEDRQYRKFTRKQEDRLVALAQGPAPKGRGHWTLRLLADRLVALGFVDSISRECVRTTLKKRNVNLT